MYLMVNEVEMCCKNIQLKQETGLHFYQKRGFLSMFKLNAEIFARLKLLFVQS